VPWTALPEPCQKITWGDNSKAHILTLMREGRTAEEISEITGNRLAFVKSTIHRALHPDEFAFEPPIIAERLGRRKRVIVDCENCGKEIEVIPSIADKKKFCSMGCLWVGRNKR